MQQGESDVGGPLQGLNEAGVLGRIANLEACYQRNVANMSMLLTELTELKQSNLATEFQQCNLQLESKMQKFANREQMLVMELNALKQGHSQLKSEMQKFVDREQMLVTELTEIKQDQLRLKSDMQNFTVREAKPLEAAPGQSHPASAQVIGVLQEGTPEALDDATAGTLAAAATKDFNESATEHCHEANPILKLREAYVFDYSVYDAVFFVFTKHVHIRTSLFITIGFLTNVAMQVGMILVLKMQFMTKPLPQGDLDRLAAWRKSEGHAYNTADAMAGVSLAARVCGMDAGLSVASSQVGIIEDAESFLGTVWEGVRLGPLLCNIALILWAFTCACEIRRAIEFAEGVMHVPRAKGRSTIVVDNEQVVVQALSPGRVLLAFMVAACRAAIAVFLATYGAHWLSWTTNVQDLLLNASALGFVLDIDETIFAVLSPSHLLGLIDSVQSLHLPRSTTASFAIPCFLGILVIANVMQMNLEAMDYTFSQLSRADDILCSESTELDFIFGVSQLGRLYYGPSVPFDEAASASVVARRKIIELIIDKDPEATAYAYSVSNSVDATNVKAIEHQALKTVEQIAEARLCLDGTGPKLGGVLWSITGDAFFRTVETCQQLKSYCTKPMDDLVGQNVRSFCPITCGCADPLAGLWHLAGHVTGCPWDSCQWVLQNALQESDKIPDPVTGHVDFTYACRDRSLRELQEETGWSLMLGAFVETGVASESDIQVIQSTGCKGFQDLDYNTRMVLCSRLNVWDPAISSYPFIGAGVMCPESCGCYYDYGTNPEESYEPGDPAICPMKSCFQRYFASYQAHQQAASSNNG